MGSRDNFELANQRANELQGSFPRAVSARYDRKNRSIEIHLSSNLKVSFSPRDAEGLEEATPSQLQEIEISPSGFGIHFPTTGRGSLSPRDFARLPRISELDGIQAWPGRGQIEKRR